MAGPPLRAIQLEPNNQTTRCATALHSENAAGQWLRQSGRATENGVQRKLEPILDTSYIWTRVCRISIPLPGQRNEPAAANETSNETVDDRYLVYESHLVSDVSSRRDSPGDEEWRRQTTTTDVR